MPLPLLAIGAGIAGAGVLGGLASGIFGKGDPYKGPSPDPLGYTYGGDPNYYGDFSNRLAQQEHNARGQAAPGLNFAAAENSLADAGLARAQQQALADRYQGVLDGTAGPSVAELQLRQGQEAATQNAANVAANARGGGLLLAQREAARQAALGGQQTAQSAALLRAQEQQAAMGGIGGLLGAIRQSDVATQGAALQQQNLFSQNALAQRGLNNQAAQGYLQAQLAANEARQRGDIAFQQDVYGAARHEADMRAQQEAEQKRFTRGLFGGMISGGASAMGSGLGGMGGGGGADRVASPAQAYGHGYGR